MENVKSPQEIANEVLPSTVLLEMKDANGQLHGVGSGFFIGSGDIATNFHVVEGSFEGSAKLFGQDKRYEIEGYTALDVNNDLIVLKIKDPDKTIVGTPVLPLGEMSEVHIGDVIYAVGNPSGLEGTICTAIGFLDHFLNQDCDTIQSHRKENPMAKRRRRNFTPEFKAEVKDVFGRTGMLKDSSARSRKKKFISTTMRTSTI